MSPKRMCCNFVTVSLFILVTGVVAADKTRPSDWPSWRGPNRDGNSTETGLLDEWGKDGPPLEWRTEGLGGGYSSISISAGKIFTMGKRQGGTFLIALSQKDGRELWAANVDGGNPNSTPTVDGNLVFAMGRGGNLICAKTETGQTVWSLNFQRDLGGKMMSGWGYSESPLVDGDRLICTPGAEDGMIVALNKRTGKLIWKTPMPADVGPRGRNGAGYSSVVISNGGGVRQYVQLTGRGLISVAAKDGRFLWSYNQIANSTANIPTPVVTKDYVFCSSGYGRGAALLKLKPSGKGVKAEEVYFLSGNKMQNHHGGMVLVGDYLYCGHGHNNGFPLCLELKTGKIAWNGGRGPGKGSAAVVQADGNLYFRYEDGVIALIEASPKSYKLKGKFTMASKNGRSWPHPVIVGRKLYLRDQGTLLCYDIAAN